MNGSQAYFLSAYVDLERRVQKRMTALCAERCRRCEKVCCKFDYCRESKESVFLRQVYDHLATPSAWRTDSGWLGPKGCTLPAGRPPVCYAFCCDAIRAAQPNPMARYALDLLSDLITYAGRNARGNRHLVEVTDLAAINMPRLTKQLRLAEKIMEQLADYWDSKIEIDLAMCRPVRRYGR
jgi:hypothetical protein